MTTGRAPRPPLVFRTEVEACIGDDVPSAPSKILLRCSPRFHGRPWQDFIFFEHYQDGSFFPTLAKLLGVVSYTYLPPSRRGETVFFVIQRFCLVDYGDAATYGEEGWVVPLNALPWTVYESAPLSTSVSIVPAYLFRETAYVLPATTSEVAGGEEGREYVFLVDKMVYFPPSCDPPRVVVRSVQQRIR